MLSRILPLLAEGANLETLLSVGGDSSGGRVLAILDELRGRDLLEEMSAEGDSDADPYSEQERFFANFPALGAAPGAGVSEAAAPAQRKLAEARVLVAGLGRIGSRLVRSLMHAGVGAIWGADRGVVADADMRDSAYAGAARGEVRELALARAVETYDHRVVYHPLEMEEAEDPVGWRLPDGLDLLIVCDEGFDPDRYDSINRLCLEHDLNWTSYRSLGARYEIGPTIVPRQTACFRCLELRRLANASTYEFSPRFLAVAGGEAHGPRQPQCDLRRRPAGARGYQDAHGLQPSCHLWKPVYIRPADVRGGRSSGAQDSALSALQPGRSAAAFPYHLAARRRFRGSSR